MGNNKYQKRVKVTAYSGHKLNERPVSFFLNKRNYKVKQIIERWRDPDHDFFKVKADDGKEYILKWNRERDEWILGKRVKVKGERQLSVNS